MLSLVNCRLLRSWAYLIKTYFALFSFFAESKIWCVSFWFCNEKRSNDVYSLMHIIYKNKYFFQVENLGSAAIQPSDTASNQEQLNSSNTTTDVTRQKVSSYRSWSKHEVIFFQLIKWYHLSFCSFHLGFGLPVAHWLIFIF